MVGQAVNSAIPAIYQLFTGIKQARMAKKMNPIRPTMTTPKEMSEALANSRNMANGMMPGMGQAMVNSRNATANAGRAAMMMGNGANAMATLAAANANEQNTMAGLTVQNANFKQKNMMVLNNQLHAMAAQKQKEWQWNTQQKYLEDAAAKSALTQAAMQNKMGGISGMAAAANSGMTTMTNVIPGAAQQAGGMMMGGMGGGMGGMASGASGSVPMGANMPPLRVGGYQGSPLGMQFGN